ncbi:MAG: hypothetical protein WBL93_01260 [Lutisporaceae bacterium]
MLKLERPQIISGISVYPDHEDPDLFYFLPGPVSLAQNQQSKEKIFHIWMYRKEAGSETGDGGGFLNFEVNLDLGENLKEDILSALKARGVKNPRLSTPMWNEGKVRCIGLDINSDKKTFVKSIDAATVPSLEGNNSAIFSLTLSKDGAVLAKNAFATKTSPIGVIYELKYTALRPALDVKVTGSYKQIYNHFSASASVQYEFMKADIDAGFEKLIKDKVIKMEIANYVPDDKKKEQEQWALELFKAQIVSQWFQPTLTPGDFKGGFAKAESLDDVKNRGKKDEPGGTGGSTEKPKKPDTPGIVDPETAKELIAAASGMPMVSVKLKVMRQEELGEIDMSFHSEDAETRTCAPQGFLGLFVNNLDIAKYISEIDLNDPFFKSMEVDIDAPFDFKVNSVSSATASICYNDDAKGPYTFRTSTDTPVKYFTYIDNKNRNYTYDLNFSFIPDDNWDGESLQYDFKKVPSEATVLHIQPHQYIYFKTVQASVSSSLFRMKNIDYVEVICNYQNPSGWKAKEKRFMFTQDKSEAQLWKLRMGKASDFNSPEDKKYTYNINYFLTNGESISTDKVSSDAGEIIVGPPKDIPSVLFSAGDIKWDNYRAIHVYVKSGDNEEHIQFSDKNSDDQIVFLDNMKEKTYSWRAVIYNKDKGICYYPKQAAGSESVWEEQTIDNLPQVYLDSYI